MNRRTMGLGLGMIFGCWALCGCGGGGHSDDSRTTIHGRLASGDQTLPNNAYGQAGSYVDVYSCVARDDGTGQVEMKSSDLNSFLVIGTDDGAGHLVTIATDDNSGSGRDAKIKFDVQGGVHYFVAATNADGAGQTGAYTLEFSDKFRDVVEEPDVTPSVRKAAAEALSRERKAAPAAP